MIRRTVLLAAACVVLPSLTLLATVATAATTVARSTAISSVTDPGGDFTFTRNRDRLTFDQARFIDLRALKVTYGMASGRDVLVFDLATIRRMKNHAAARRFAIQARGAKTVTRVEFNQATTKTTVTRHGKRVACATATASTHGRQIHFVVARDCLGAARAKFRFSGWAASTGTHGVRAFDTTSWSPTKRLDRSALTRATIKEPTGDLVFVGDPAASGYAGESIDLSTSKVASGQHGVTLNIGVADPSYYPWDVRQHFVVTWRDASGARGTLSIDPNRTEDGTTTVTGTGALASCSVAVFTVAPDVGVSGLIPATCLSGRTARFGLASASLTEDGTTTGTDTARTSKTVLLT